MDAQNGINAMAPADMDPNLDPADAGLLNSLATRNTIALVALCGTVVLHRSAGVWTAQCGLPPSGLVTGKGPTPKAALLAWLEAFESTEGESGAAR